MGIIKDIWKRVSDLDGESAAVEKVAGEGRIPFKEVSKKLKEVMNKNTDVVGRKIIIPNYYAIHFGEEDRQSRREVEDVMADELRQELYHEMRKTDPEKSKAEIIVEMKTDRSLERGEFRIEHHVKKPEATAGAVDSDQVTAAAAIETDEDVKATVVEQVDILDAEDQATIVQSPATKVLYKLLVDDGQSKRKIDITERKISIGRSRDDDVVLESPELTISRAHARLELRKGKFFLFPSGINGTYLNDKELELEKEISISRKDEIRIAEYRLKFIS